MIHKNDIYIDMFTGEVFEYIPAPVFDDTPTEYFLDNYGTCELKLTCLCLKPENPWLGRACENWTPLGPKSHEELYEYRQGKSS